jgi:hypothetical protein
MTKHQPHQYPSPEAIVRAALERAAKEYIEKLEAKAMKVRPFVWDDASCGSWAQSRTGAGWEYFIRNMGDYFLMPFPWKPPERFPTLKAAKAAAQADYEARILSALEPTTPSPEAIVRAALELAKAFDWAIAEIEGRTRYDTDEQRQNAEAEAINRLTRFRAIAEGRE